MRLIDRVEGLLKSSQTYRDSDKMLLLAMWHLEGLQLTPEQRHLFMERCSTAESITRARRQLKGRYPASEAVNEARFNKMKDFQDEYRPPAKRQMRFFGK